jgi:hypothetical protein
MRGLASEYDISVQDEPPIWFPDNMGWESMSEQDDLDLDNDWEEGDPVTQGRDTRGGRSRNNSQYKG